VTGLEYIRSSKDLRERGLYVQLHAYECEVFLDWREVRDDQGLYARLAANLNGRGVPSIDDALRELALEPVLTPFRDLVNPGTFRRLLDNRIREPKVQVNVAALDETEQKMLALLRAVKRFAGGTGDEMAIAAATRRELDALLKLPIAEYPLSSRSRQVKAVWQFLEANATDLFWGALLGWLCVHSLGEVVGSGDAAQQSRVWIDEWLFGKVTAGALGGLGLDEGAAWQAVTVAKTLTAHPRALGTRRVSELVQALLSDDAAQQFLHVNRWDGTLWFNKETYEQLVAAMFAAAVIEITALPRRAKGAVAKEILACCEVVDKLQRAEAESKFQVEALLTAARQIDAQKRRASAKRKPSSRKTAKPPKKKPRKRS
jgi:hypothetical protein